MELTTTETGDGGDVDDGAFVAFEHVASDGLGHEEGAGDVGVDDLLPTVEGHGFGGCAPGETGIVDEDVDIATSSEGLLHNLID